MRSTTLRDVAERVGVSARTVSRAVNGEPGLSDQTRARVLAVVDDMGYQPNMLAKGLRANRTNTIGLVVTDLSDPYFPGLAQSIQRGASAQDHTLLLAATQTDREEQARVLTAFRTRGVDGLVLFPVLGSTLAEIRRLVGPDVPLVVIDDASFDGPGVALVDNDLRDAARQAVEHLVELGHERVAMLGNTTMPDHNRVRERGYRDAMVAAGLGEHAHVERTQPSTRGGRAGMLRLLERPSPPTAVFAYNDLMAIGAMDAVRAAGLRCPEDVSVVGVDDIDMAELVWPALTTVRMDRDRLGRTALERLMAMVGDGPAAEVPRGRVVLEVQLVVRASTARPSDRREETTG